VRRECEGYDVESGVFAFYADDGARLRPCVTRPAKRGFLGFGSDPGEYVLERGPSSAEDFNAALADAAGLQPNGHFATLDDVRAHVDATRAALAPYLGPG
jgi:hypothetical protein